MDFISDRPHRQLVVANPETGTRENAPRGQKPPRKRTKKPVTLGEYEIELSGKQIKFVLKKSRMARMVWLKIRPETGLAVTVPSFYNIEDLPDYLKSRSGWIRRHLEKCDPAAGLQNEGNGGTPQKIAFLGNYYSLQPNSAAGGFTAIALGDTALSFNISSSFGQLSERGMRQWLKEQASRLIAEKIKILGEKIKVEYKTVYIKDQRSLWGSCSARKNLSFNWRLIMVPEKVMDYVIIHELCHLKEMSHSKAFWNLVAEFSPEWQSHRRWLNEHCYELKAQLRGK